VRPPRRNNKSPLDAEAQDDPEERWVNAAREIRERIERLGPGSPEGRAYGQLKALMGEGSLLHALGAMLRQVRMAESRLAADRDRKRENALGPKYLKWLKTTFERRQRRAIADARVYTSSTAPSRSASSASFRMGSPISRGTTSAGRRTRSSVLASIRAAALTSDRIGRSGMRRSAAAQRSAKA
jgi:hypothetical protein